MNKNLTINIKKYADLSDVDILDIISNILEKNGVKETSIDYLFSNKGEISFIDKILTLSEDLLLEQITNEEFINSIKNDLNLSEQKSKNILTEVKEKVLPLGKIIEEKVDEQKNTNQVTQKIERPIGVLGALKQGMQQSEISGITPSSPDNEFQEYNFLDEDTEETFTPEPNPKPEQPQEVPEDRPPARQNKSDDYREPIE